MSSNKLWKYAFFIAIGYILLFFVFPKNQTPPATAPVDQQTGSGIILKGVKDTYHFGDKIELDVKNTSAEAYTFQPNPCPGLPIGGYVAYDIQPSSAADQAPVNPNAKVEIVSPDLGALLNDAKTTGACSDAPITIEPGKDYKISLDPWYTAVFTKAGQYTFAFDHDHNPQTPLIKAAIEFGPSAWYGKLWDLLFYQPLYNSLIFLTGIFGNNLGWAIIALTILIRLILLIPNQQALESQKKIQLIQPKITEIQEKYKGDTKKIGEETMKIWKENKVNPVGSCLPLLLQLPFLIALYRAVSNGLQQSSTYYLYEPLKNFSVTSIHHTFLGLDLSKPEYYFFPLLLVVLQWYQMHLSLLSKKGKEVIPAATPNDPNAIMGKSMKYAMPLLIGFMSISFPSGVAVYWGISTLFGIAQQLWVNKITGARL